MSKKRIAIVCTSIALSAAVTIGGTLALLTHSTEKVTNTFSMGSNISGTVSEPLWNNGDQTNNIPVGKTLAEHIVPNLTIPKDPYITNTSTDQNAWVAIKLDISCNNLTGEDAYYAIFGNGSTIPGFAVLTKGSAWTQSATDPTIFYYNTILPSGTRTTEPAFSAITINSSASYGTMHPFTIDVYGYLVQSETFTNVQDAMTAGFSLT